MHYPNKAFSVNGGVTLARKGCGSSTTGECQLGQYNGFSASDVKGLNILYGCSDSGTGGGGGGGGGDQDVSKELSGRVLVINLH